MYTFFLRIAQFMAYLGGIMLSILIVITCVSILGRGLNSFLHSDTIMSVMPGFAQMLLEAGVGAINGDFELVEAGMAFSIFAFLPLCQIRGGHAAVDIFTSRMSRGTNRVLLMIADVLFAAVLILIAVQLYDGMASKLRSGQTSFLLQYPVWWGYALSLTGAVIAALVATFIAFERIRDLATGRDILPQDMGAEP